MREYWTPDPADVIAKLGADILSVVEHRSDYGRERPDWEQVLGEVEGGQEGLDLGSSMDSPVVKAVLREARRVYHEMRDANE